VFGDNHRLEKKLRESGGVCAEATILKRREGASVETSNWKGERNVSFNWHLTVQVARAGGELFESEFTQRIGGAATALMQQGLITSIPVIFDPGDHGRIALDQVAWEQRVTTPAYWTTQVNPMGGAVAAPAVPAAPADPIDALTRLADLRDQGVLTDAEFEVQKAKVLGS
jgi:Short C-terminal domain